MGISRCSICTSSRCGRSVRHLAVAYFFICLWLQLFEAFSLVVGEACRRSHGSWHWRFVDNRRTIVTKLMGFFPSLRTQHHEMDTPQQYDVKLLKYCLLQKLHGLIPQGWHVPSTCRKVSTLSRSFVKSNSSNLRRLKLRGRRLERTLSPGALVCWSSGLPRRRLHPLEIS